MPNILVNGRFLTQPTTGVQRYAREILDQWDNWLANGQLDPKVWKIEVLAPSRNLKHNLKAIPVRAIGRFSGHLWEQFELPRHLTGDLLFCPCNTAPISTLLRRCPTVVTVHDLSYKHFPDAYSRAFRSAYSVMTPLIFRYANLILTDAESERRNMLREYPDAAQKLRAIHLGGISRQLISHMQSTAPDSNRRPFPYVLFVGSMCRRKNVDGAMQAVRKLTHDFPRLRLVVAGASANVFQRTGPDPSAYASYLVPLGRVEDAELVQLYRDAACFVFPSFQEGSGLPPIEAMACGCPVVASGIPVHYEHLGDAAAYCNPEDPADIARAIRSVLSDPALAEGLRQRGIRKAAEYSWNQCAAETLQTIASVLESNVSSVPARRAAA